MPWFQSLGIQYFVGVDGISMAMVILTSIIIFTGVLASWYVETRTKEFFVLLLTLVTGVFGVFVSFDLFLFFMFYELAVLPMYLLIGIWGTGPKEYSAMKLTLMLLVGSAFVLVGFLALYHASGLHTFDLQKLAAASLLQRFPAVGLPDDLRRLRRHRGAVSAAHLVAGRPQLGPDGRLDAARRRADEARRLRRAAHRGLSAARRREDVGPVLHGADHDQHPLRLVRRDHAEGPEVLHRLFVGQPLRLRALRRGDAEPDGASRAPSSRCSATAS